MKKSHPAWAVHGFEAKEKVKPKPAEPQAPTIRMLDIAAIRSLEDKMMIEAPRDGILSPELEHAVNKTSREVFGITEVDTEFEWPEDVDESDYETWKACDRYEEQFEFPEMTDDEAVEMLKRLGLDFTDDHGFPLLCIRVLGRQAEAAAKRIMGRMPAREEVARTRWASSLERDARRFFAEKRKKGAA